MLGFAAAALSCFAPAASAASSSVVISQVYGAGGNSGAVYQNDYVELFNLSGAPVSVSAWSVQYTSATGTGNFSSFVTALSGTIPAGGYYLVKLAGGASGVALPAADATGTTNMAAGGGKVILANVATGLACNGSSTPCNAAQLAQIVDLVGQGGANFFEGSGAAPAPSTTLADFRASNGCTDTDNNSAGKSLRRWHQHAAEWNRRSQSGQRRRGRHNVAHRVHQCRHQSGKSDFVRHGRSFEHRRRGGADLL
jgi:predicted extracellular nuclease